MNMPVAGRLPLKTNEEDKVRRFPLASVLSVVFCLSGIVVAGILYQMPYEWRDGMEGMFGIIGFWGRLFVGWAVCMILSSISLIVAFMLDRPISTPMGAMMISIFIVFLEFIGVVVSFQYVVNN